MKVEGWSRAAGLSGWQESRAQGSLDTAEPGGSEPGSASSGCFG